MATIRYFLPEDGDHEDAPNVYLAPKPSRPGYPPMLGQIRGSFPLPGSYHFRFKTALIPGTDRDKDAVAVWMDCVDDSEPVCVWQGAIIAKVNRIGLDDDDDDDFDEDFAGAGVSRAASNVSAAPVHSAQPKAVAQTISTPSMHSSDSLLGALDDPPAPAAPAASVASSVHSSTGNLLDVDNHPPAPAPASGGSLLDMDHLGSANNYTSSGANTPTTEHNDLLNMSAPMPVQGRAASVPPQAQHRPQPMQQGRPQQAPTMQGQYPMQYPPQQPQYPQQGMAQMPAPQQQQSARNGNVSGSKNAFDKFSGNSLDPLGNLNWGLS